MKSIKIRSFFWSVFSCILTEYGDLRSKFPYLVVVNLRIHSKYRKIWTRKSSKKTLSRTLTFWKELYYLLDWKPFKIDEKGFLFHLKSSFRSQDIQVFVTTFCSCRKNGLIGKIRLTSKFIMSQPGLQTIAIHILPNISQSKCNQTMKFYQLMEYNKTNIFLQKLCGKWGRETSSRPLFVFQKA